MQKQFVLILALASFASHLRAADQRPLPRAPAGFVVQLAAAEPHVKFPMFACFDDAGRLFVAESSGLDLYDELQKQTRRCRISVLEDKDRDGVFESATVFADKLVFPMGLAWRDGRLYVADPPELVTLEDTDNDGKADKRTKILDNFGHQDNGSLHGLYFGPDGLLYMTMGQPDGYRITKADGTVVHGTTGAVLRCRPDGSHPEVIARGFENAVEVCFLPAGQIIATDNWFQLPAGGVRDALVHIVEGGLYPKCADRGSWQIITGDDSMPAVSMFPAVALSGICRYEGAAFPGEFQGNLYTAQHNTRKVQRHVLKPAGHTFTSQNIDFVTSDDPDFHPSDVLEAPDGSLLIVDTGGWYVQHCPTGKIRDSKAPGGIYRVISREKAPWGEPGLYREAWKVSARQTEESRRTIRNMLTADSPLLCAVAARTLITRPDRAAAVQLANLLRSDHADVRLAAAQALASSGDASSTSGLIEALKRKDMDRVLEHALVHALHHQASFEGLRSALRDNDPRVQAAALMLLDQPPHRNLDADALFARLSAPDPQLSRTALRILQNHPEWSPRATDFFTQRLADRALTEEDLTRLADTITALGTHPEITNWLAKSVAVIQHRRTFLLQLISRIGKPKNPAPLIDPLRAALGDPITRAEAITTAATLNLPALDNTLTQIAADAQAPKEIRLAARRATIPRHPKLTPEEFSLLLTHLTPTTPASARLIAIDLATRADLADDQLPQLLQAAQDDPLVTPDTLRPLLAKAAKPATAKPLLNYLAHALERGWTPTEQSLTDLLKPLATTHAAQITPLLTTVRKRTQDQQKTLDALTPLLTGGDESRGRELFFNNPATACATCHRTGTEGGMIGPDLTKVGAIRSGRDLLESIVFPSSTIAQGYDNYIVTLTDGDVLTGLITDRSPEAITLKDNTTQSRRLATMDIRELRRSETSIMPQGLHQFLAPDQLKDLLAYLQSLR